MAMRVVDQGEAAFLTLLVAPAMTCRLFRTDVETGLTATQMDALDESDFTAANFAGYSGVTLSSGNWTVTEGSPSSAVHTNAVFTRSSTGAAQNIYGYYVTRNSDGALQWYEQFDAPMVVEFSSDAITITPTLRLDDVEVAPMPTGVITPFAGASSDVPAGTLLCDGTAVSRTTYSALFALIGTTYGVGDGSTTFNLPDLRARAPYGRAASGTAGTLGATFGAIDHTHSLAGSGAGAQIYGHSDGYVYYREVTGLTSFALNERIQAAAAAGASSGSATGGVGLTGSSAGSNPPGLVTNYVIFT